MSHDDENNEIYTDYEEGELITVDVTAGNFYVIVDTQSNGDTIARMQVQGSVLIAMGLFWLSLVYLFL